MSKEYTAYWECRVCGAKNRKNARCCWDCDTDLVMQHAEYWKCTKCDANSHADAKHCWLCGANLAMYGYWKTNQPHIVIE